MADTAATRRGYVDGRWGQIHYYAAGPPPGAARGLVCFHMTPFSGRMFELVLARLADIRAGVAFDTPGYGHSDPPPQRVTIGAYAAAMGDVVDALGFAAVDVMGAHTGSRIAVEFALQRPEQVRKVVLLGAACYRPEETTHQRGWTDEALAPSENSDGVHLKTVWHAWARNRGPDVSDAMIERYIAEVLRDRARGNWAMHAAFDHDMPGRLAQVEQPILVLNAQDDIYDATKRSAEVMQNGRIIDLAPDKLWAMDTRPDKIADLIRGFLDEG